MRCAPPNLRLHHDPAKAEQLRDAIQDALNSAIELEEAQEEGALS